MITKLRFVAPLVAVLMVSPCFAAYTVSIKTFDSGGNEEDTFAFGDTVTVGVFADDLSGAFSGLTATSARILATTTDGDDYAAPVYNPLLGTGLTIDGPPLGADLLGFTDGAFFGTSGTAVSIPNTLEVFTFDFTFDGPGDTTFRLTDFALSDATGQDVAFTPNGSIVSATVTAVPEPATFAALGLVTAGAGIRRYRRRKTC